MDLSVFYVEDQQGLLRIANAKVIFEASELCDILYLFQISAYCLKIRALVLKVSVYCLDISSIVREAVATSCLSTLVCKVRSLWLQCYRLLREVETLRDQYVINLCVV